MRASISVYAAAALLVGAGVAWAQGKPNTGGMAVQSIAVEAAPIATFARDGSALVNARLEWRGGLVLTSKSSFFGGWSGLLMGKDGKSLLAVSDAGLWMTAELRYDEDRPRGLGSVRVGPVKALNGGPLKRSRDRDAEGLALASGTLAKGTAYLSFEQNDRIGVVPLGKNGLGTPARYMAMPGEAVRNGMDGFEAITVLEAGRHKGSLVAFNEYALRGETQHRGWIWVAGVPKGLMVPDIGDYGVTGAASLPDGGVLILERRFRVFDGVRIRLRHLPADALRPGATAKGDVLLEADGTKHIDNLEALDVTLGANGETVVTLLSDDNYNRTLQRTILLQFALKAPSSASAEETGGPKAKER